MKTVITTRFLLVPLLASVLFTSGCQRFRDLAYGKDHVPDSSAAQTAPSQDAPVESPGQNSYQRLSQLVLVDYAVVGGNPAPVGAWDNQPVVDHVRTQARLTCSLLGGNPDNIGLPFYAAEVEDLTASTAGYTGIVTFDCYKN